MKKIRVEGSYQGYKLKGVSFRRTEGLNPDSGYVLLDYSAISSIELDYNDIPWRPAGAGAPCPISIRAWFKRVGNTVVSGEKHLAAAPPPNGKLGLFGDLVLKKLVGGKVVSTVTYSDIYLDDSGLEEVMERLAAVKSHSSGPLRVPITDIRKFYPDHGTAIQRINCRLASGELDPYSLRGGKEEWSAAETIRWLFSQLPGSPEVLGESELFKLPLPAPADIVLEAEPGAIRGKLDRLLSQYRLAAKLTRGNNYVVNRIGSKALKYGQIAEKFGGAREIKKDDFLSYERKTATFTNRAWAVQVFGKPPVRRITLFYVSIFQNTNKRYYRLVDIGRVWKGYSYEKASKDVFVGHEKNWVQVPPVLFNSGGLAGALGSAGLAQAGVPIAKSEADFKLHAARVKIMKDWAFRGYAPAVLFTDERVDENGVPYFTDADLVRVPFLPMEDVALYPSEIGNFGLKTLPDDGKPDKEVMFTRAPIVRAQLNGEGFFRNFEEIDKHYRGLLSSLGDKIGAEEDGLSNALKKQSDAQEGIDRAQQALNKLKDPLVQDPGASKGPTWSPGIRKFFKSVRGAVNKAIGPDKDNVFYTGPAGQGEQTKAKSFEIDMRVAAQQYLDELKAAQKEEKEAEERINKLDKAAQKITLAFSQAKETFKYIGGMGLKCNLPWGLVEEGQYRLDERTGIVMFAQPACHMNEPFLLDNDSASGASSDGAVVVVCGYAVKANTTADLTSVILVSSSRKDDAAPIIAGVNRSTMAAAKVETAPLMQMYLTELGTPMNLTRCIEQAIPFGAAVMGPRTTVGFVYEFSGFLPIELDGGTTMVQYVWEPRKKSRTFAYVNAPKSSGPLGPAALINRNVPLAALAGQAARAAIAAKEPNP